jgi:Fe-S oxidoreductase
MPPARTIPAFAPESFKTWWRNQPPRSQGGPQVVLWADTFNNYFSPETAQAAVNVLEAAGYDVVVPEGHFCCGRPLYDNGFLGMARSYLSRILVAMQPFLETAMPVVVLEPSCCSVFRDELIQMFPQVDAAKKLADSTFLLSEFLSHQAPQFQPPRLKRKAIVQGHCHHKAIMRLDAEKEVMTKMDLDFKLLESGCCGMAGAFGYETGDKYEVSVACAERVLLPEVRKAELSTIVIADGFSCKSQIEQGSTRHALHLAEVMQMAMQDGPQGPEGAYPERRLVEQHKRRRNKSMLHAALFTAAVVIGGIAARLLLGKSR